MNKKKELMKNKETKKAIRPTVSARAQSLRAHPVSQRAKGGLGGFMAFVREQGVVGLAIGLVLGTQVKALVDQLVESFLNPFIGLILPGSGTLDQKSFHISLFRKGQDFGYGAFISVLISFIAVAAVVYFVVKGLKLDRVDKKKE